MAKASKTKTKRIRALPAAPAPAFDPKRSRHALSTSDAWADDGEDAFHKNRDEVFFERQPRTAASDDELSEVDEVFGLNLPTADSDGDDEELAQLEEDDAEGDDAEEADSDDDDNDEPVTELPRGRFAKTLNPSQDRLSPSSSRSPSPTSDAPVNSDDEEDVWAPSAYHVSRRGDRGEADSSDDEAAELELSEARRLQRRARDALVGDEDFGLDEPDAAALESGGRIEEEVATTIETEGEGEALTKEEAVAVLLKHHPETLALLDDFADHSVRLAEVEKNLDVVRGETMEDGGQHPSLVILELEHQALATYLPTLAFYFSLLLLPTAPSDVLLDKVLGRLSTLRTALATMDELDLTSAGVDSEDEEEEEEEEEGLLPSEVWDLGEGGIARLPGPGSSSSEDDEDDEDDEDEEMEDDESSLDEATTSALDGLTDAEVESLMATLGADATVEDLMAKVSDFQASKLAPAPSVAAASPVGAKRTKRDGVEPMKKRRKPVGVVAPPTLPPLAPPSASTSKTTKQPRRTSHDDLVDPVSLSSTDTTDKASARHTLRFHVSQVHQKSRKRESGGKNRVGGDEDLPRRSRERSRREVLRRQEHGGGGGGEGTRLDGMEWDDGEKEVARGVRGEGEDYYESVRVEKEEGRRAKKAKYDGERAAEKAELESLSASLPAGPRSANRKMLANKGLQPKRAKVNRNPRVKKRMQYEGAKKKVASMKSIYKGGLGSLGGAGYEGEKSGIGKSVVKSVRL